MDNETAKHLWPLRKVNEVLIQGLRTAIPVARERRGAHTRKAKMLLKRRLGYEEGS